jgi:hypothetical protein
MVLMAKNKTKLAWLCEHTDRLHMAKGLCGPCYDSQKYWKNPEAIREKRRVDRKNDPEKYATQLAERVAKMTEEEREAVRVIRRRSKKRAYDENPKPFIEIAQKWYRENTERKAETDKTRVAATREKRALGQIESFYHLSPQELKYKLEEQKYACICGENLGELFPAKKRRSWTVDHDHDCCPGIESCGQCVRGILCNRCNLVMGHLKEDPKLLPEYMKKYLEKYQHIKEKTECQPLNLLLKNLQLSVKNTRREPQILSLPCSSPSVRDADFVPEPTSFSN